MSLAIQYASIAAPVTMVSAWVAARTGDGSDVSYPSGISTMLVGLIAAMTPADELAYLATWGRTWSEALAEILDGQSANDVQRAVRSVRLTAV